MIDVLRSHFKDKLELPLDAVQWLLDLWGVIQVFDDVADNTVVDRKDLDQTIFATLIGMPSNPFFQRYSSHLLPVLANAFLKSETKAKRRVTLSICGLGLLDESEVDSIPAEAKVAPVETKEAAKQLPTETKEAHEPIGVNPADYVCTFGKYKGLKIGTINRSQLRDYVDYIERKSEEDGKEIKGSVLEFINMVDAFLAEPEPDTIPF